jgi:hypothetical protein
MDLSKMGEEMWKKFKSLIIEEFCEKFTNLDYLINKNGSAPLGERFG